MSLLSILATLLIGLSPLSFGLAQANNISSDKDKTLIKQLATTKKHAQKLSLLKQLSADAQPILIALLDAKLYFVKKSKEVVIIKKHGTKYQITSAFDTNDSQIVEKRIIKKITINNRIRRYIKNRLSLLALSDQNRNKRLIAIQQIATKPNPEAIKTIGKLISQEQDSTIKDYMHLVLLIHDLDSPDISVQRHAIEKLHGHLNPVVKTKLLALKSANPPKETLQELTKSLESIEQKIQINKVAESLFFGLSYGSILVLVAIGLSITFGVMRVINMAHGELVMLGAYSTYVIQTLLPDYISLSLLISIPVAFIVSALFGVLIQITIVRHLKGRILETLLATFGVSLILQQLVRTVFSPLNQPVSIPNWMAGAWQINPILSLTYNRIFIIVFCLILFALLYLIMQKTRLGLEVRAVSQDKEMASAMGIQTNRVNMMTFGLGSGIAGMAGVALSQLTNVGPNLGQSYIVDSFMVVVFGGVGNLMGTLVSGLSIGVISKFIEPWVGAVVTKIMVLVFIIFFIQKRPKGLFPQKGRALEQE